jgi:hypothetical protein
MAPPDVAEQNAQALTVAKSYNNLLYTSLQFLRTKLAMKFTDFLQGIGSPIAFYPDLIAVTGSPESAIFLCQLTYWTGRQHDPDRWIHKTQEEWFFEIGLTEKQQKTARDKLVARGYIEEREIGSPARLQYRVNIEAISAVWEVWAIVGNIKKQLRDLTSDHGTLMSRGILNYAIKNQIQNIRTAIRKCHTIANGFFETCEKMRISPVRIIDRFRENLTKIAQTLATGLNSQPEIQVSPNGRNKYPPTGETSIAQQEKQVSPDGTLAPPSIPVPVSVPAPSKITPKTSTDTPHENVQGEPENTHTWGATFKKEDQEKCLNREALKDVQIPEEEENYREIVTEVQVEVVHDTQQERKDKELNSQGQDCIFMEANIPGGGGAENFESVPDWVLELQEKVRLGHTLKRPELLKLANYRLGDYANSYRHSGRVLDASPDDIKADFLKFVQWHSFHNNPDSNYVLFSVKKAERQPEQWDVLLSWVRTWEEVQKDPKTLETMLAAKVSSEGKKCNTQDLSMNYDLNARKAMSVENWWEAI